MLKPILYLRIILLLAFIATVCFAQAPPALPVEVQRQGDRFFFVAQPDLSGFRAALYDRNGSLIAESEALTDPPLRWPVLTAQGASVKPGVYLCVLWLRGQGSAAKRLARLEVRSNAMTLQSAELYLAEVEPPDSVFLGTPEYRAVERRAYKRGVEAIPFFRVATKVLPEDSAAYLLLVQAIQTKYARFDSVVLPPPPPPPPPPPAAIVARAPKKPVSKTASRRKQIISMSPQPTSAEKREMLSAGQKAVAVAKTCPEKTNAMRWLASIQAELDQQDKQIATLEQMAEASCATNEIKVQAWYNIGVLCWQCAYDLTTRYAKREQLSYEPFHYRNISAPADKNKFAACLQKAIGALEKALALKPDYAEALSYRSLLYREQQKTTKSPTERQKWDEAAQEAAKRAIEIFQKQRQ